MENSSEKYKKLDELLNKLVPPVQEPETKSSRDFAVTDDVLELQKSVHDPRSPKSEPIDIDQVIAEHAPDPVAEVKSLDEFTHLTDFEKQHLNIPKEDKK